MSAIQDPVFGAGEPVRFGGIKHPTGGGIPPEGMSWTDFINSVGAFLAEHGGLVGPPGPPGEEGGAQWYVFPQDAASNNWLIEHGLGRLGVVAVIVDSSGTRVLTRIEEVDEDAIRSITNDPFSGKAYVLG